ncbi:hypothetical protein BH11BAC5_BH11BAC5_09870 [soil metagenome]|jgi:hypothetical protein
MHPVTESNPHADSLEEFDRPKIYSKKVIYVFSFLMSTIFGGILLMQNLRDLGRKKEANIVLIISIAITFTIVALAEMLNMKSGGLTIGLNVAGGALLSEYFFKKYIPDESDYEKKPIWKPLIIAGVILLCLLILFVAASKIQ